MIIFYSYTHLFLTLALSIPITNYLGLDISSIPLLLGLMLGSIFPDCDYRHTHAAALFPLYIILESILENCYASNGIGFFLQNY